MRTHREVERQRARYQQALQQTNQQLEEAARLEEYQEILFFTREKERLIGGLHALEWALSSDTDDSYLYPWACDP